MVAEYDYRRGGRGIVSRRKQAPAERLDAERGEIVAGDVLGAKRPGSQSGALMPDAQAATGGLESSHLFELRCFGLETLVERIGEHSPAVLRAALHTAVIAIADPV